MPTTINGCNWRPARTPDSLEELQPPRRALILSLKLRKETVNYNIHNLLQSYVVPVLIVGSHEFFQSKTLGHHTWKPVKIYPTYLLRPTNVLYLTSPQCLTIFRIGPALLGKITMRTNASGFARLWMSLKRFTRLWQKKSERKDEVFWKAIPLLDVADCSVR